MSRITGEKNELSDEEKIFFDSILGNKYTILQQLGRSGRSTSSYLLKDSSGKKYVIKVANNANDEKWIISQKEAIAKREVYIEGYKGNVAVPSTIAIGDNYIIEPFLGVELNHEIYEKLEMSNKSKIAKDLAGLLNFVHSKTVSYNKKPMIQYLHPPLKDIYKCFENNISDKQRVWMQKKIEEFEKMDSSDELTVLTHRDIRSQNLLYDEDTGKLALIDFETVECDNIYTDFVPSAAASFGIPYEFWNDMITEYNKISKLKVDPNKIKILHEMGIFHEYGRCAIYRKTPDTEIKGIASHAFDININEIDKKFYSVEKEDLSR